MVIDPQLKMNAAIDKLVGAMRPKIKAMLRMRGTYKLDEFRQFKTHIWGFLEYHCGSIAHASDTALKKLDRLYYSYLEELRLDDRVACLDFNFPPPAVRRNIALLGFLHKRVLKQCHPALIKFLPPKTDPAAWWHNQQLE